MASIQKKGKKFYVTYREIDRVTKEKKPIWESFDTEEQAKSRLLEIDYEKDKDIFIPPSNQTISEFLDTFVEIYGTKKWSPSTYSHNISTIKNYILPLIGDCKLKDFKALNADKYMRDLNYMYSISSIKMGKKEYLSDNTIERIGKLLKTAFKQAKRWELITKDPFKDMELVKAEYNERDIWNAEQIQTALDCCDDALLYVAINLAFSATLRIGEMLGLTWDNVIIDEENVKNDNAYVIVDKQLQRINKKNVKLLRKQKVLFEFPSVVKRETKTALMLVSPKTKTSNRKVWIPRTVAYMLKEWKKVQDENKESMGNQYYDYNLVFANEYGRPNTEGTINKRFKDLQKLNNLPVVDLHSLRHSSTTYKLKLNRGDLKATQGDTGHATTDMIMKIYAHILDEDRKINARKMEDTFYSELNDINSKSQNLETQSKDEKKKENVNAFLTMLQESPDLRKQFAQLMKMD